MMGCVASGYHFLAGNKKPSAKRALGYIGFYFPRAILIKKSRRDWKASMVAGRLPRRLAMIAQRLYSIASLTSFDLLISTISG